MTDSAIHSVASVDVSRETYEKLQLLVSELQRWQAIKNLVGPGTLDHIWNRHIEDSLQLLAYRGTAGRWFDLGSGAGFPGLVLAIAGRETGLEVALVESNARKCAFLRHAARVTETPVTILEARVEQVVPGFVGQADIVSARALASLTQLIEWTAPLLKAGTTGMFPKGRDLQTELTDARKRWTFEADIMPSRTDSEAGIIRITSFET
ncbi:16S rRNA (guanine(527)-N(7))-methyltransferase RsmG [Microvirga pudoricolor]|uniref:16S rRNA (guanine(527)-N(7))-methyltransferase RsmG n=1 Tax=Microvirga pudoricolor TaxID=2778729 RepID=UPI00194DEB47|nr:16S rRNA (guanine(527)-N(7))-methyltransferase RsmG [Microvirga pudoricolor]MBM6593923.1 16S rRNA (guanine(527)-N(7))-methyltransferase RsmG [Microvirga pudoricolor]